MQKMVKEYQSKKVLVSKGAQTEIQFEEIKRQIKRTMRQMRDPYARSQISLQQNVARTISVQHNKRDNNKEQLAIYSDVSEDPEDHEQFFYNLKKASGVY